VSYDQGRQRYVARLMIKGSAKYLGAFDTAEEAHAAYEGAVLVYGKPKRGVLSEAQLKRRDERYNEWLVSRVSLTDSLAPILPYDPHRPWPVVLTAVKLPDGAMFRLQRYEDRLTILGAVERVAVFTRRCRQAQCKTLVENYLWLGPDRKWQHKAFDACAEHMSPGESKGRAFSVEQYARVLKAWDAVHASLGRDRSRQELPRNMETEARRRAALLRPALRQLLEVVYDRVEDVPEDWWRDVDLSPEPVAATLRPSEA